ncbi:aldehyde dehydrogenase family protein [Chloroflexota bacterium]
MLTLLEEPIKEVVTLKNFIDGEWVEPKGKIVDIVDSATNKVIAKVLISTKDEIQAVVETARVAFPDWRRH